MLMSSKNSVLAKFKSKAVFSEFYSEADFENDCILFENMILDLSPVNKDMLAYFYLTNLKEGKMDSVKLVKFKTALLISPGNREWLTKQPKSFLKKLKRRMKKMKKKVKK